MDKQIVEGFRLSPQQEQLWALQLEQPDEPQPLRASCRLTIKGTLDAHLLREAVEEVVRRHEILRTTYEYLPAMTLPVQVINDEEAAGGFISWHSHDLSELPTEEQTADLEAIDEQARLVEFDFERGPLMQVWLVKLAAEEHQLSVSLPSLCADARSLRNLMDEVARGYAAIALDTQLLDVPLQYADFAEIQHELLESDETEAGRAYWHKLSLELASPTTVHHLDSIQSPASPSVAQFLPRSLPLGFDPETVAALDRAATQQHGCSLSDLLLTCWLVLLRRVTGNTSLSIGLKCEGRKYETLRGALGLFARYLPLSSEVEGDERFGEVLEQVRERREEVERWQEYYSLDELSHGSTAATSEVEQPQAQGGEKAEEKPGYWPVCFAYEEMPVRRAAGQGETGQLRWHLQTAAAWHDRFAVQLRCTSEAPSEDSAGALVIELDYDGALYEEAEVERFGQQFKTLVQSVMSDAERRVAELEVVSEAERRLLREWNATEVSYEQEELCLHELVQAQAEKSPQVIALVYEQEQISYRELNERANQLAHYLRRAGIGEESLVGILMNRSVEMVISLLAVLKAGAAYVPLDPGYPPDRLRFMIEDAGVRLLLTHRQLDEAVKVSSDVQALDVESQWAEIAQESIAEVSSQVSADNLAYVIYTSGSTGTPKGVMISHRSILNRLLWMHHSLPLLPSDRLLQKTPFSFDASVWELFLPLICGAELFLARPGGERDTAYLAQTIRDSQITIVQMVPSLLRVWLQEREASECHSLRRVFCGGEELTPELRERFFSSGLGAELHNLYGPTEVSIDATHRQCLRSEEGMAVVPIGRAIGKMRVYVLDERGREVGIGVRGELHIGGVGLARGYQGRGELTAERFMPDGVSGERGGRIYGTGDMGRYRRDGELEYLGRGDGQVKVRGNRIELAEIEAALRKHRQAQQCVVLAKEDQHGDKRLIAYVVAAQGEEELTVSDLRNHLGECVPAYMMPSAFVMLNDMPLMPNGKIDRRALLAIEPVSSVLEDNHVAARNPIEEILVAIWAQLLGVKQVSRDDNFFELGGHSLLAMQVTSRIREALQVELPLRNLFEAPTVGGLAVLVEEGLRARDKVEAPPLKSVGREEALPLSFAQQRLWFLDQLEPGSAFYNLPEGIRLRGPLNVTALASTLAAIIHRHESLRTTFSVIDGEPVQVIHGQVEFHLPLIDLSLVAEDRAEAEAARLAKEEAGEPFDLAVGPLVRARVLRLGAEDHVVLLTMHHIISDGWSMGIFVKEVATLYAAITNAVEPEQAAAAALEPLPIQYADYALWQREWLTEEVLDRQLSYWKKQLEGAAPVLDLPTDKPRPAVQTFSGLTSFLDVDKSLSESLEKLGRENEVTMFMLFLAVFQVLLHYHTKQDDIVIGTDVANRNKIETEGLIGFFINQLVLRGKLSSSATFRELLAQAREISLGAYTHQEFPFDKLVEALKPKRDLRYSPLFQVKFFYQNAPATVETLSDLTIENLDFDRGIARLDLTLALWATPYGFRGWFNYNTDLFTEATIRRMSEQFKTILARIVERPDVTLDELEEGLATREREQQAMEKRKLAESNFSKFKKNQAEANQRGAGIVG